MNLILEDLPLKPEELSPGHLVLFRDKHEMVLKVNEDRVEQLTDFSASNHNSRGNIYGIRINNYWINRLNITEEDVPKFCRYVHELQKWWQIYHKSDITDRILEK